MRCDEFIYEKSVKITSTGMVVAKVLRLRKNDKYMIDTVGIFFFHSPFMSLKGRFKRAHIKADERIALCEKYESGPDYYAET